MQVLIGQSVFTKAMQVLSRLVPKRSLTPDIAGVHIEAHPSGVRLFATDLQTSITIEVEAQTHQTGETTVMGRVLADVIQTIKENDVLLSLSSSGESLRITAGTAAFRLPTLSAGQKPLPLGRSIPDCAVEVPQVVDLIQRTSFCAVDSDELSPFAGVYVSFDGHDVTMAASDNYQLAYYRRPVSPTPGVDTPSGPAASSQPHATKAPLPMGAGLDQAPLLGSSVAADAAGSGGTGNVEAPIVDEEPRLQLDAPGRSSAGQRSDAPRATREAVLPTAGLLFVARALHAMGGETVNVSWEDRSVRFENDRVQCRLLRFETAYPDLSRFTGDVAGVHVPLSKAQLSEALRQITSISQDGACRLCIHIEGNRMHLSSEAQDSGEAHAVLSVEADVPKRIIWVDAKRLLASIRVQPMDDIVISISEPLAPVVISPATHDALTFRTILTPLRQPAGAEAVV